MARLCTAIIVLVLSLVMLLLPEAFAHQDQGNQWVDDWVRITIINNQDAPANVFVQVKDVQHGPHGHWMGKNYGKNVNAPPNQPVTVYLPTHQQASGDPECTPAENFSLKVKLIFKRRGVDQTTSWTQVNSINGSAQGGDWPNQHFSWNMQRESNTLNSCDEAPDYGTHRPPSSDSTLTEVGKKIRFEGRDYGFVALLTGGTISTDATITPGHSILLNVKDGSGSGDLMILLPNDVLNMNQNPEAELSLLINGEPTDFTHVIDDDEETILLASNLENVKSIEIISSNVIPEFSGQLVIAAMAFASIVVFGKYLFRNVKFS